MHEEGATEHIRQAVHIGQADLQQAYAMLVDAKAQLERATYVLQGVTRASASEAPGRALISLHKAQDEIDQALNDIHASSTAAEHWAAHL